MSATSEIMVNSFNKEKPQLYLFFFPIFFPPINWCTELLQNWLWQFDGKSFPNKSNYVNYGGLMSALKITSHSLPPFQSLSKDPHHTGPVEPSAGITFTEESYHRLRCSSVSGTLLRTAPSSMRNPERRRDARRPGGHMIGGWKGK